jgi:hypothetical protein
MKPSKSTTAIHEFDGHGNHRIVILYDDATNAIGSWFPTSKIANLLHLRASADPEHNLPIGLFITRDVPFQTLG